MAHQGQDVILDGFFLVLDVLLVLFRALSGKRDGFDVAEFVSNNRFQRFKPWHNLRQGLVDLRDFVSDSADIRPRGGCYWSRQTV